MQSKNRSKTSDRPVAKEVLASEMQIEVRHRARPRPAASHTGIQVPQSSSAPAAPVAQPKQPGRQRPVLDEFVALTLSNSITDRYGSGARALQEVNSAVPGLLQMAPYDASEQMLASQMQTAHKLAMEYASAVTGTSLLDLRRAEIAHKFMTLFSRQKEVLDKSRGRGSHQKITVEKVTVKEGGNAIIGNVGTTPSIDGKPK